MNNELLRLMGTADDLSIKLRFARDYLTELRDLPDNLEKWETQIEVWEKELAELNGKITELWLDWTPGVTRL